MQEINPDLYKQNIFIQNNAVARPAEVEEHNRKYRGLKQTRFFLIGIDFLWLPKFCKFKTYYSSELTSRDMGKEPQRPKANENLRTWQIFFFSKYNAF